jgi:transcription antitermination factor NusG
MAHMPLDASVMAAVDTDSRSQRVDERCGSRWGVAHTHPQAEQWARANLLRQGYDVWWLTRQALRRDPVTRTMTRPVDVPLFTSYIFVAVPLTQWGPICHTLGIKRLLMSGEKPYTLTEAAQSALHAVEALAATHPPTDSWTAPGVPCSLGTGAFRGHEGVIVRVDTRKGTADVAMLMFGELRTVSVELKSLQERV